jgi:hypothetical protein
VKLELVRGFVGSGGGRAIHPSVSIERRRERSAGLSQAEGDWLVGRRATYGYHRIDERGWGSCGGRARAACGGAEWVAWCARWMLEGEPELEPTREALH